MNLSKKSAKEILVCVRPVNIEEHYQDKCYLRGNPTDAQLNSLQSCGSGSWILLPDPDPVLEKTGIRNRILILMRRIQICFFLKYL